MKHKFKIITSLALVMLAVGCGQQSDTTTAFLTKGEIKICNSADIDTSVISSIRKFNSNRIGTMSTNGLIFTESYDNTPKLISSLKDDLAKKGCTIFLFEDNFGLGNKPSKIVVLKTTDKYAVLKQVNTNGKKYGIDTDSLISIVKQFDEKYSLEITGAAVDWCEFNVRSKSVDWNAFAEEVYKVCPGIVDQGTGTVKALAEEMKELKRVYMHWD